MIDQRIFCAPTRDDGRDEHGNPGDCFKTCIANLLDLPYEDVPHFVLYASWWAELRRWARVRGGDFQYYYLHHEVSSEIMEHTLDELMELSKASYFIGSGPSPRGAFNHVVLVDERLKLVHDPHPSRAGILNVADLIVYTAPYDPPPLDRLQLG